MNINNYNDLLKYLDSIKDEKYKKFHQKILKNKKIKLFGIRTPKLKELAKYLSKNYEYYIEKNTYNTYEETILHGLMLGYLKIDFNKLLIELDNFIPHIDNWATCDLTVSNLKQFKKNQEEGFKYIKKCITSKNIWKQRVGVVLLNSYYINDNYINQVLNLLPQIKTEEYYLEMGIAWTLSTCFINYPDKTKKILEEKQLQKQIHNKTIQKIIESTKIDKKTKENLNQLKIKA